MQRPRGLDLPEPRKGGRGSFPESDGKHQAEKSETALVWARMWGRRAGRQALVCAEQCPLRVPRQPPSWAGKGTHLFSMACRNSSKVRKGVPSPQMPRRLM